MNQRRFLWALGVAPILAGTLAVGAVASKAFSPPPGWDRVGSSSSPDSPRRLDAFKQGDGDVKQTLTVVADSSIGYADLLARIRKNIADIHPRISLDHDQTCDGKQGHLIELVFGGGGRGSIMNQLIVPDGDGTLQITYTRMEGQPFLDDVKAAIADYCGIKQAN